jgi:hypothetical protein
MLALSTHATWTSHPGEAIGQSMSLTSREHEVQAGCRGSIKRNDGTSRGCSALGERNGNPMMRRGPS